MPKKSESVKQTARSSDTSRLYAHAYASCLARQVATKLEGRRRLNIRAKETQPTIAARSGSGGEVP